MMKSILVIAMAVAIPLSGFAEQETENKGALGDKLKQRFEQCKPHFDIEPYFILAVGGERDERITEGVEKSLANFSATGKLILPANKKNNPTAVSCATFAEGVLVGAIGARLVSGLIHGFETLVDGMFQGLSKGTNGEGPQVEKQ